jgi:DNA-directed RNA polymerase specialized sigma24 family protein
VAVPDPPPLKILNENPKARFVWMSNSSTDIEKHRALVRRASAGDAAANKEVREQVEVAAGRTCETFFPSETRDEAKKHLQQAIWDNWPTISGEYKEPISLERYIAVISQDLLLAIVLRLYDKDMNRALRVLVRLYFSKVQASCHKQYGSDGDDIYQSFCVTLWKDDWRVLRGLAGKSNLQRRFFNIASSRAKDIKRAEHGRLHMPAAIEAMGPLEQAVFWLLYRDKVPADRGLLFLCLPTDIRRDAAIEAVDKAMIRVLAELPPSYSGTREMGPFEDGGPHGEGNAESPKEVVISGQRKKGERLVTIALANVLAGICSHEELLYWKLHGKDGLKPAQIALRLGTARKDVYEIARKFDLKNEAEKKSRAKYSVETLRPLIATEVRRLLELDDAFKEQYKDAELPDWIKDGNGR